MELDAALGSNEPDQEIHELLLASVGVNLGLDYLPGSMMFDPAAKHWLIPSSRRAAFGSMHLLLT